MLVITKLTKSIYRRIKSVHYQSKRRLLKKTVEQATASFLLNFSKLGVEDCAFFLYIKF